MEETSIPTIIKLMKEEQEKLKSIEQNAASQRTVLQNLINELENNAVFNNSFNKLSKTGNMDPSSGAGSSITVSMQDRFPDYPFSSDKASKICYILESEDTVMRIPEIKEIITQLEGPIKAPETLKSLNHALNMLVHNGALFQGKVDNSKRKLFYGLKRFFHDADLKPVLKQQHVPKPNTWFGGLPKQKFNAIYKVKWIGGRKM